MSWGWFAFVAVCAARSEGYADGVLAERKYQRQMLMQLKAMIQRMM